jgi:hypothetical protein
MSAGCGAEIGHFARYRRTFWSREGWPGAFEAEEVEIKRNFHLNQFQRS